MTSAFKIETNRQNGRKSHGPVTDEGKSIVARNAVKHGLLSKHILLDSEDHSTFQEHADALNKALSPVGALENLLTERIIASSWRLNRIYRLETELFARSGQDWALISETSDGESFAKEARSDSFCKLARYESTIEKGLYKALHELQRLQAARGGQAVPVPMTVDFNVSSQYSE